MGNKNYLASLRDNHPLFQKLKYENPAWWQLLKAQNDCYIDVRKDNSMNLYYNGGSMFRISRTDEEYRLETHSKYSTVPLDCLTLNQRQIDDLKIEIAKRFPDGSESAIKAKVVCENPEYIDSEFAHPAVDADGKPKVIRIDLVRLRGNTIEFVELKRFGDNRLLDKTSYTAPTDKEEILTQIREYESLLREKHDDLIRYYSNLLKIKRELRLFSGTIPPNLTISDKVVLLIDMTDYDDSCGKRQRLETLRKLIKVADITAETTNGTPL